MTITRRRFIAVSAAAGFVPTAALGSSGHLQHWSGVAMGARASLSIAGLTGSDFTRLVEMVTAEINRLENIFSLYRADSELSRLNASGTLEAPAIDFLRLLSHASSINRATNGAFDPTIQPLWDAYAHYSGLPDPEELARAKQLVGWKHVLFNEKRVAFDRPGMAVTLNGIAQGYATDRIADLLRSNGLVNVLVSVGEIAAVGERDPGKPWRIGISDIEDDIPNETVTLTDMAIATSSPTGMTFGPGKNSGHIFNPHQGRPMDHWQRISVISKSAAVADGLSTAFCVMCEPKIRTTLKQFANTRLIAVDQEGNKVSAGS